MIVESEEIILSSNLFKKGLGRKTSYYRPWTERLVSLDNSGKLSYFDGNVKKGEVELRNSSRVQRLAYSEADNRMFAFEVVTFDRIGKATSLVLAAKNQENTDTWINELSIFCRGGQRATEKALVQTEAVAAKEVLALAESKAAEEERMLAEAKAAEEELVLAQSKAAEEERVVAESVAAEEARVLAEAEAAEEARVLAEAVAAEEAFVLVEAKAAEEERVLKEFSRNKISPTSCDQYLVENVEADGFDFGYGCFDGNFEELEEC